MEVTTAVSVPLSSAEAVTHGVTVPLHLVPPADAHAADHGRSATVVPLVRPRLTVRDGGDLPVGAAAPAPMGKRVFDVAVSATLLVLLMPLILVVALLIKLDSRGPVFYRTERAGHGGRPLHMLKFRKMHADASGLALTLNGDTRFTRLGQVAREDQDRRGAPALERPQGRDEPGRAAS